jgi:hypothetical protein
MCQQSCCRAARGTPVREGQLPSSCPTDDVYQDQDDVVCFYGINHKSDVSRRKIMGVLRSTHHPSRVYMTATNCHRGKRVRISQHVAGSGAHN